MVRRILLKFR